MKYNNPNTIYNLRDIIDQLSKNLYDYERIIVYGSNIYPEHSDSYYHIFSYQIVNKKDLVNKVNV